MNKAEDEEALLEKQRHVLSQLNIKVIIHKRYEDGTVDFEITGILPTETESDIKEINETALSNSNVNSDYLTIEQTWALLYVSSQNWSQI